MTVQQLMDLPFNELKDMADKAKVKIANHYKGNKLPLTEFMQLKGIEATYNLKVNITRKSK